MSVKIFQLSFYVFTCACPTVTSSIFGKSFHFPFPYFVLSVLRYFPFHVVSHTKNGKRKGKLLLKNKEISGGKTFTNRWQVFVCAFSPEISSFFDKSFPFFLHFLCYSYFSTDEAYTIYHKACSRLYHNILREKC